MILDLTSSIKLLKSDPRPLLGIDPGSKTLGLALAPASLTLSTPLKTLKRTTLKKDFKALHTLQEDHPFGMAIIGLPLNMDGTEGPRAQSAKQFGFYLSQEFSIPVCFWDERLSTQQAYEPLLETTTSKKTHDKLIDQFAAQIILQGFLDFLNTQ